MAASVSSTWSGPLEPPATIPGSADVVIPLMIVLQLARDFKIMDLLAKRVEPVTRLVGMSGKGTASGGSHQAPSRAWCVRGARTTGGAVRGDGVRG